MNKALNLYTFIESIVDAKDFIFRMHNGLWTK